MADYTGEHAKHVMSGLEIPGKNITSIWKLPSGARPIALGSSIGSVGGDGVLLELLSQRDQDALRAADVTEPILVLILGHLAHEFCATSAQAGKDVVDIFDGEHDATYTQRVHRCVFRLSADRCRGVELRQLNPAVTVRGPHHCHVDS